MTPWVPDDGASPVVIGKLLVHGGGNHLAGPLDEKLTTLFWKKISPAVA